MAVLKLSRCRPLLRHSGLELRTFNSLPISLTVSGPKRSFANGGVGVSFMGRMLMGGETAHLYCSGVDDCKGVGRLGVTLPGADGLPGNDHAPDDTAEIEEPHAAH